MAISDNINIMNTLKLENLLDFHFKTPGNIQPSHVFTMAFYYLNELSYNDTIVQGTHMVYGAYKLPRLSFCRYRGLFQQQITD